MTSELESAPDPIDLFAARLTPAVRLGEERLSTLKALIAPAVKVKAGARIAAQGVACGHVHLIKSGWACRTRWLSGGRRHIAGLTLPGHIADLDRIVLKTLHVGVDAVSDCEVVRIAISPLRSLLESDAELRRVFNWLSAVDASIISEWQACVGRRPAFERLAHFACEILIRIAEAPIEDGFSVPFPLTQSDLADLTGLSSVHVNRTLQALRLGNLLKLADRRLEVLDWNSLERAADFNPAYLHI